MGGDHGPTEVVPGVLDYARAHPTIELILVGDEPTVRRIAGALPANVRIVHAGSGHRHGRAPGARPAREEGRLDPRRDGPRPATARPTPSSPPATRAPAWPPRSCASAACPASTGPALAVQMITDYGPLVLLDIGANPDSTAENLAQYARMGAIFAEKVLGVADPRVALL